MDLLTSVISRAGGVKVKSAINPLLWLSAVSMPVGVGGALALQGQPLLAAPILAVGLLPPLGAVVAYFYFMVRDPDRLQSEDYLIEQRRLTLEQKGVADLLEVDRLPLLGNPEHEPPPTDLEGYDRGVPR